MTARRAALAVLALVVVLLVVAQVLLPRIAEGRVRDELRRVGAVSDGRVRAIPAVKLLWGNVDFLGARVDRGSATRDELGDLLSRTREIDVRAAAAGDERLRVSASGRLAG